MFDSSGYSTGLVGLVGFLLFFWGGAITMLVNGLFFSGLASCVTSPIARLLLDETRVVVVAVDADMVRRGDCSGEDKLVNERKKCKI